MTKSGKSKPGMRHCVGFHAVESLLSHNPATVVELLFDGRNRSHRQKQVVSIARSVNVNVRSVAKQTLEDECGSPHHQGVVAILESEGPREIIDIDSIINLDKSNSVVLMLDQIQDPHNLGACLRTAECAGVDAVILPKDGACPVNQTVRKVASGAAESLNIIYVPNLVSAMNKLQQAGYWIYGTSDQGESTLYDCEFQGKLGIVMGGEGDGMRRLTSETCDYLIRIPLYGNVSSLNVSVATGVTLFEICRQRGKSDIDFG